MATPPRRHAPPTTSSRDTAGADLARYKLPRAFSPRGRDQAAPPTGKPDYAWGQRDHRDPRARRKVAEKGRSASLLPPHLCGVAPLRLRVRSVAPSISTLFEQPAGAASCARWGRSLRSRPIQFHLYESRKIAMKLKRTERSDCRPPRARGTHAGCSKVEMLGAKERTRACGAMPHLSEGTASESTEQRRRSALFSNLPATRRTSAAKRSFGASGEVSRRQHGGPPGGHRRERSAMRASAAPGRSGRRGRTIADPVRAPLGAEDVGRREDGRVAVRAGNLR